MPNWAMASPTKNMVPEVTILVRSGRAASWAR
jgi:hypothetical protein